MFVFYIVTRGSKDDMNTKNAILYVASDMLGSLADIVSRIVIIYTGWMKIDPILSFKYQVIICVTLNLRKTNYLFLLVIQRNCLNFLELSLGN